LLLLIFMIAFADRTVTIVQPRPVAPAGGTVVDGVARWQTRTFDCQLRALDATALRARLTDLGVSERILEDTRISTFLENLAPLEIAFRNTGTDDLVINPDQVILLSGGTVTGRLVRTFDFLPSGVEPGPELRALAAVFSTASFQVAPGDVASRLLVFAPLGRRFPKKIAFRINHLYQGGEDHPVECHFRFGYREP